MQKALTVSDVNKYIKGIFSSDMLLSGVLVSGEISNFKLHYSGHMYFTLKDELSVLKSVMFKTTGNTLAFTPENGMKVVVRGYISVFERDGQYQLYAQSMQPDGVGSLHIAFEQLKKKLEIEGLFDTTYKKPIPFFPKSIGVITSSTGSVVKDIIHVSTRRNQKVNIKIFPVQVQGDGAAASIVHGIEKFNELKNVDVIIIARGGGSLEELWAFNEEKLARSVFNSNIPVISAVGHETDFTICDFVADLRAPTPSAAAELAVPDLNAVIQAIQSYHIRLQSSLKKKLELERLRLKRFVESRVFRQPYDRIYQERLKMDALRKHLENSNKQLLSQKIFQMGALVAKLDALSPLNVLTRGYSIVKRNDNKVISSIKNILVDECLTVAVSDGEFQCTVNCVNRTKNG